MSNSYKFYSDTKDIMKKYVNATEGAIIYGITSPYIAEHEDYQVLSPHAVRVFPL